MHITSQLSSKHMRTDNSLPAMFVDAPALRIPWFGRTQYRFGAVVFTLNVTFLSAVFVILRLLLDTSSLNGPKKENNVSMLLCVWCNAVH